VTLLKLTSRAQGIRSAVSRMSTMLMVSAPMRKLTPKARKSSQPSALG